MINDRRNRTRNGLYVLTATLRDRRSDLLVQHIDPLFQAWRRARRRVPHRLIAFVVMPDHLHAVVRMTDARDDCSRLVQDFKKVFTHRMARQEGTGSPWQPRFREDTIRDAYDLRHHIDYIHFNPVKHGCVVHLRDWRYSSFRRYVRDGRLPSDWAGGPA